MNPITIYKVVRNFQSGDKKITSNKSISHSDVLVEPFFISLQSELETAEATFFGLL